VRRGPQDKETCLAAIGLRTACHAKGAQCTRCRPASSLSLSDQRSSSRTLDVYCSCSSPMISEARIAIVLCHSFGSQQRYTTTCVRRGDMYRAPQRHHHALAWGSYRQVASLELSCRRNDAARVPGANRRSAEPRAQLLVFVSVVAPGRPM
jgi:hypothetical protein